jgi:hypothetical protein
MGPLLDRLALLFTYIDSRLAVADMLSEWGSSVTLYNVCITVI